MLRIERLDPSRHDRDSFDSGEPSLDDYLARLASQHLRDGIATTHVLVDDGAAARVIGYYAACAAQLLLADLSDADRARLPRHPVPALRVARLAVDAAVQGRGHGALLLADAVQRALDLRASLGIRVVVVDALHARTAGFYRTFGFRDCTTSARSLYLPLGRTPR